MRSKKIIATLVATLVFSTTLCNFTFANNSAEDSAAAFDENNIVTRLGVISDVHQNGVKDSVNEKRFRKAVQTLYSEAGGTLDGIAIAGDIGEYTFNKDVPQFKEVLDSELKGDTRVHIALGNHDASSEAIDLNTGLNKYNDVLADYYKHDEPDSNMKRESRHTIMGGYHFLSIYTKDYYGDNPGKFAQQDKDWLEARLAEITAKDPNKYVFLNIHPVIRDTVYAEVPNNRWSTADLTSILKKYPQVVALGGHIHQDIQDERAIWQGDFTSIQVPSLQNLYIENPKFDEISANSNKVNTDYSAGFYFEIDKNGAIKINRLNFLKGETIKEPWIIPAPKADKSHLKYYSNEGRMAKNTAPTFGVKPTISMLNMSNYSYDVYFKSAQDDDMVYYYDFVLTDLKTGEIKKKTNMLSRFYDYSDMSKIPKEYTKTIGKLEENGQYKIDITAYDTWLVPSETISKTFTVQSDTFNPELIKADLFNMYAGSGGIACDLSPVKNKITTSKNFPTAKDEATGITGIDFSGDSSTFANFTLDKANSDKLKDGFTLDFFYKWKGSTDGNQYLLSNGENGLNVYIDAADKKLTLSANIGGEDIILKSKMSSSTSSNVHVVITYDGSNLDLIINGFKNNYKYGVNGDVKLNSNANGETTFTVGGFQGNDGVVSKGFNALSLKTRVWANSLNMTHVKELYKAVKNVEQPEYIIGDANTDGKVNTVDALLILRYSVKLHTFTPAQLLAADYDQNSKVNTVDSLRILRKAAGME